MNRLSAMALVTAFSTLIPLQGFTTEAISVPSKFLSGQVIAQASASKVGSSLIELETNIKWSAVDKKWASRRDGWVSDVQSARSASQVAALLTELESYIQWSAVEKKWESRRDGWIRDCNAAQNPKQVANLLIELETNIKWSAVEKKWESRRDGWIQELTR